jgi:MarR family transcriptional regulator, organic hydroperoxide resistance regulator
LDYLPRYTPIVRALMASEPLTVGDIAAAAGISQPAATQPSRS